MTIITQHKKLYLVTNILMMMIGYSRVAGADIVQKAESWFAMKSNGQYSLIGCTVAPGFNYEDFELAPENWKPINFNIDLG